MEQLPVQSWGEVPKPRRQQHPPGYQFQPESWERDTNDRQIYKCHKREVQYNAVTGKKQLHIHLITRSILCSMQSPNWMITTPKKKGKIPGPPSISGAFRADVLVHLREQPKAAKRPAILWHQEVLR